MGRQQILACQAVGLETEAYLFVEFFDGWEKAIDDGLTAIEGLGIRRIWLDLELSTTGDNNQTIARIRAATARVKAAAPSLSIGYYTRASWWNANCSGVAADDIYAADLWLAHYEDPASGWHNDFGQWKAEQVIYQQYASGATYVGLNVDLNVILVEEDMVDTYTKAEVDAKVTAVLGLAIKDMEQIDAIGKAFADHVQNHSDSNRAAQQAKADQLVADFQAEIKALNDRLIAATALLEIPPQTPGTEGNAAPAPVQPLPPNPAAPVNV